MNPITDPALIAAILSYCKGHRIPCWVIHTPPESTIGGFSCQLLEIKGDVAVCEIASGDRYDRPMSEISATIA